MKPILHLGDTASPFIDKAANAAPHGSKATLTDAGFVEEVTGISNDRDLGRLARRDDDQGRTMLREAVSRTGAVMANMKSLAGEDLKNGPIGRIIRAALRESVPVMLEGTDGERMSHLTGAGLTYDAVIIEPTEGGTHCRCTYFGENRDPSPPDREAPPSSSTDRMEVTDPEVLAYRAKHYSEPTGPTEKAMSEGHHFPSLLATAPEDSEPTQVALKVAKIMHMHNTRRQQGAKSIGQMATGTGATAGGQKVLPSQIWTPNSGMLNDTITISLTFDWTMVNGNESGVPGKYLRIRPSSVTLNPNPLGKDSTGYGRGYFTERIELNMKRTDQPDPTDEMKIQSYQPVNANNTSKITTSTGFTADSKGTITLSSQGTSEVTLADFKVIDNKQSDLWAQWIYRLGAVEGYPYNNWGDLIYWGFWLCDLPDLAKYNFNLGADAVFRCAASYTGSTQLKLGYYYWARYTYWATWDDIMGEPHQEWRSDCRLLDYHRHFWFYFSSV